MSRIKHPMSFLYGFSMKMLKKARYPNVMNYASHIIFILIFPWKCQKSSIPKCHKLSIRYHWYLDFSMKMSKKKLDTQMSQIKHHMSVSYGFFHENVPKSSIPKCQELSIQWHFYLDFSLKMSKKARYPNVTN